MSKLAQKTADWADDPEFDDPSALPGPTTTHNPDGTITTVSYSFNDAGAKVKATRRIRSTVRKSTVNPRVAEHKSWSKFGFEKGKAAGPGSETTSIGENIIFNPSVTFKKDGKEQKKEQESGVADLKTQLKDKKVKCRICDGDHFTARCPFKDTMAPVGEDGDIGPSKGAAGIATALDDDDEGPGAAGKLGSGGGGGYVPPHLRKGGAATTGERMGGKYEKDDLATLRVTNVSESAEENELRDIFERFGRVTRVFLARDKETGRAKGFAFISYQERTDAARACEKLDGYGYQHLILRVEFAKRTT